MDLWLPVDPRGLGGSQGYGPRYWRDIHRSDPLEISQTDPEPLELDDLKKFHYRDGADDEDGVINDVFAAVRRQVEYDMGCSFVRCVLEMTFDQYPIDDAMPLPLPPLISVTSLSWFDWTNTETVVDPSTYLVDDHSKPGRIVLGPGKIWPVGVRPRLGGKVRWAAGSGTVPDRALHAMRLLLGHWLENREAVTSGTSRYTPDVFPLGYEALIADRMVAFG